MKCRLAGNALSVWAGATLAVLPAWADTAAPGQEPTAAHAYVDRVLDDGPQAEPRQDLPDDATGWARGWSIEAQSTAQRDGSRSTRSQSLLFSGHLDTPDHGSLSARVDLTRNPVPVGDIGLIGNTGTPYAVVPYGIRRGSTWRIDQRALPFDGGWFGNHSIGDIHMASTSLARGVGRVFLPNPPIEGASATLEQPGQTSLNASAGRLGYFDGISFQGLSVRQGTATSVGAQTRLSADPSPLARGRTDAAVQILEARHVDINGVPGFARDSRSVWTALSWQGLAPWADTLGPGFGGVGEKLGGLRIQANLAHSAGRPSNALSLAPRDAANGVWVDATWRTELLQQTASFFHFDPSLRWGADNLPNDLRGASWRGDISARRWQLGTQLEVSDSVGGARRPSVYGSLFGRYRIDSRDSVSVSLAARSGTIAAQSAQSTWEHRSDWGYTQWRTDAAHGVGLRVLRTGIDHSWKVSEAQALSTSLAIEQSDRSGVEARSVHWGMLATGPVGAGARLDLSVRGSRGISGNAARFLSANARLSWPLGLGWSFIAQYTAARGQEALDPAVVSALTASTLPPVLLVPASRTFLLALRFEDRAGIAVAPIGGAPGAGAGRLEGHVYFDDDRNARRDAGEGGVPGVTVLLDGRYVAVADAQGFYSFASVAAGTHEIELQQEGLPLPWSSQGSPSRRAVVSVRDTSVADFPVQKER